MSRTAPHAASSLGAAFSAESPLAAVLPDYVPRAGQTLMAEAVAEALERREVLVVEAGTGTGKTFAYLLPALFAGLRTIVSTGTRALQDQLFHRDLPLLARAVGRPVETALLKGRANYLCLHRLELAESGAGARAGRALETVRAWSRRTKSGDRGEVAEIAEDDPVWQQVTSTVDNCLGQRCGFFEECYVVKARRAAQSADMVVVNHHLLLADLAMKEEGFADFLPDAEAFVLDEAHQLPDLATQFFGVSVGSRQLGGLLDEVRVAGLALGGPALRSLIDATETAIARLRAEAPRAPGRYETAALSPAPGWALLAAAAELAEAVAGLEEGSLVLERARERLEQIVERLRILTDVDDEEGLRWVDVGPAGLRLHLTPLDVADRLAGIVAARRAAWVLTSATLAVGEDFGHFLDRSGLAGRAHTVRIESPYDLAGRALVYLPPGLPAPGTPEHTRGLLEATAPLLAATGGGAFYLFTSHRALREAARWCAAHPEALDGRRLLVQGEAPRAELLARFRSDGRAALLGTGTFWEGVDVRGEALTLVVIDKLPFASPSEPLTRARAAWIERRGGNPFTEHQLPQAVLSLKQGAGRLLRHDDDYGAIVLGDPRVSGKPYGRLFLQGLAPMPVTRDADAVRAFFARHGGRDGGYGQDGGADNGRDDREDPCGPDSAIEACEDNRSGGGRTATT